MSVLQISQAALAAHAAQEDGRHAAIMDQLAIIRTLLMPLAPEVQALHDAVAAQNGAITSALTEMTTLEAQAASLTAQLANVTAGAPIDSADLAEIVANTTAINGSITNIKAAMPQPVAAPVVAAAAAASDTPTAGTTQAASA